jgi:hypothetical protein
MHEKRKVFSKQNASLELYRRRFYKSLESTEVVEHQVAATEIKEFRGLKEMMKVVGST